MAKVNYNERMDVNNAVAYIENIIAGLKQGSLSLNYGEDSVDFSPNKEVELAIHADSKGRKGRMTIDIAYKNEKVVEEPVMTITAKKSESLIEKKAENTKQPARAGAK